MVAEMYYGVGGGGMSDGGAGSREWTRVIEWLRLYGKSHLPPAHPSTSVHLPSPAGVLSLGQF